MGGETGIDGSTHVATFAQLVQQFGWSLKGRLDSNVPCQKCARRANGDLQNHGIDGIFVIDCPFSKKSRGIVIDGKRYIMKSVGSAENLTKLVNSVVESAAHLHDSPDTMEQILSIDRATIFDTAILAWYCHEDFNANQAAEWIRNCQPSRPRHKSMIAFIMENTLLSRLKSLESFLLTVDELEFFYFMIPEVNKFSSVLAPEMLFSAIQPFRYIRKGSSEYRHGIFFYDVEKPANIRFILRFIESCFAQSSSIEILAHCSPVQLTKLDSELKDQLKQQGGGNSRRGPEIVLKTLAKTIYEA